MKIYVDEMPKCCKECGFCYIGDVGYWCQAFVDYYTYIGDKTLIEKRLNACPLATTQSLKQQVRAEVVEEIRELCEKEKTDNDLAWLGFKKLNRILDQVKGEKQC